MPSATPQLVPAIEMQGVSVGSLRDLRATVVEGIDWTVNPGEYWVIAGLHNCGKTDLLSVAAGLMPPQTGEYRLFGRVMPIAPGESLADRLRVGLLFDGGQMLRHLTVRENVALPLRYHYNLDLAEAEPRVQAMLELTDLSSSADALPGMVGRNIHKRVGLARALMLEPDLLVLDNPLGDLDLRQMQWWLNFLDNLASGVGVRPGRPMTLVASGGDLRPWRDRASHFAVLRDRRFITVGGGSSLATHPEPLVKELLAEASA